MNDINQVAPMGMQLSANQDATFERMLAVCYKKEISPMRDRVSHRAAARIIGVHWQTLHRIVGEGRIKRVKIALDGSHYSYRLQELADFLG
jgi:hypothetical protein